MKNRADLELEDVTQQGLKAKSSNIDGRGRRENARPGLCAVFTKRLTVCVKKPARSR